VFKVPIGWLQLKKGKLRFAVALSGVSFAVLMILMQLGFQESLYDSSVRYHDHFRYDIAILSPETSFIAQPRPFARRRLYQVLGVHGVDSVSPVLLSVGTWKNPWSAQTRSIFVAGFRPDDDVLALREVSTQLDRLKARDVVLFDALSRPEYGPVSLSFQSDGPLTAEVNNREVEVRGIFELGTSFGIDGSLITSDVNFRHIFPDLDLGLIHLGLIRVEPGVDTGGVAAEIRALLPADVVVLTRDEYVARELEYWEASTPIGYVFGFGVIVGFVVGSIIVYQILFADVSDHLPEYATLKAMGYSDLFLSGIVIQQALILSVLGYVPAFLVALWLYRTAGEATHLPIHMTLERAIGVLGLAIVMCSISAVIALRRVRSADPAEIF
jgi:putative ABC transport system permease protein